MANTGRIRYREIDTNPNSPTVGQERWSAWEENQEACPIPTTYYSDLIEERITRNNCASGYYGSSVRYILPDGAYSSTTSKADAQQQAQTYFDSTKQAYANQNGSCTLTPPSGLTYSPVYYTTGPNAGCFACLMVNDSDAGDTRNATDDENQLYFRTVSNGGTACEQCETE